jgi:hypothetical protein
VITGLASAAAAAPGGAPFGMQPNRPRRRF